MSRPKKTLTKIVQGEADKNIVFKDMCNLLRHLEFEERIRGDHHIFSKDGIEQILNLQPKGNNAKPYQVKQVRKLILQYSLGVEDDD